MVSRAIGCAVQHAWLSQRPNRILFAFGCPTQLLVGRQPADGHLRFVALDPHWLSSSVAALATGIKAESAYDRMPVLADALEDAGCHNADILAHCRGDGPHVRGCWVVEMLLGKS